MKRVFLGASTAGLAEINNAIDILVEKLPDCLEEIGNEEKSRMAKLSDKNFAFVQKTYEYSLLNSFIIPPFVNLDELRQKVEAFEKLRMMLNKLNPLIKGLEDSYTLIGSDTYTAILQIYDMVKLAAKDNHPGAQTIYEDLKTRFEKQGPTKKKGKMDKGPTE